MRHSFKYRIYPTSGQQARLVACLNDHRDLYNAALQERRDAYRHASKTSINYGAQSAQLKEIRRADPDGQGRWSFSSQQATLRRLNRSFAAFFERAKAGKGRASGFPRFKGPGWFDTVEWPKDGDGARWNSQPHDRHTRVYLRGVGHVKVRAHRPVQGRVKTISVKREGTGPRAKWFVVLSCDDVPMREIPTTGEVGGIDMGIAHFLTTSDAEHVPNPRFLAAASADLATAQQALARTQRGSKNRWRARQKVAAIHARVGRQRRDFHHKAALNLLRRYHTVVVEDLRIANMTRSAAGTLEAPGTNVAQKAGLNRSILDAGWSQFLNTLTAKAESAGRDVVRVNPTNTSRTCPSCGHIDAANRPSRAVFACACCGHAGHADVIAATNILRRGLAPEPKPSAA